MEVRRRVGACLVAVEDRAAHGALEPFARVGAGEGAAIAGRGEHELRVCLVVEPVQPRAR